MLVFSPCTSGNFHTTEKRQWVFEWNLWRISQWLYYRCGRLNRQGDVWQYLTNDGNTALMNAMNAIKRQVWIFKYDISDRLTNCNRNWISKLLFVDFEKTFDSVKRGYIKYFSRKKIPKKLIDNICNGLFKEINRFIG